MIFGDPFETAFDLPPATIQYKTYSLDAIMALVPKVPYKADARLEANPVHAHCADGIIELGIVESYQADALAEARLLETYRMSGSIRSNIHEYFYVVDGAVMKCNVRAYYRMGGIISNSKYVPRTVTKRPFSARQSLIVPEDINSDDRFDLLDRRIAVASNKQKALKQSKR